MAVTSAPGSWLLAPSSQRKTAANTTFPTLVQAGWGHWLRWASENRYGSFTADDRGGGGDMKCSWMTAMMAISDTQYESCIQCNQL